MHITVLEFLNAHLDEKFDIYLYTFNKQIVKIEPCMLWEMLSLYVTDASEYPECVIENAQAAVVCENEITYLRRKNKEQAIEIQRLRESLFYYRDSMDVQRNSLSDAIVHAFMPKGYSNIDYLNTHNSTPYRRGIANSLFVLDKRGYVLPEDVKSFMTRYKTRKTTRR